MPVELAIPIAILLVFLNGFFVAAEFALVKVRHTRVIQLAEEGSKSARMTLHAVNHLDAYLSATQLGITLASIGLGWVGEPAFAVLLNPVFRALDVPDAVAHGISFAVAFTTVSVLHIVLGELAPKSWAIQRPETVSLGVAYPLHGFYVLFRPAIVFLNGIAGWLLRRFGIGPTSEHEMSHSQEELSMILTASGESGVLKKSEVDLMRHVFQFGDRDVSDVMVPRIDIVMLDETWPISQAVEVALKHAYSRYPVGAGDADSISGVVHIRDLLTLERAGGGSLSDIKREIPLVPTNKALDDLLRDFQRARVHMALVVDEYGGTRGLVTLEDVLEQIVGRIDDETDEEVQALQQVSQDTWHVLAKLRLIDLNEAIGSDFSSPDYETIGGYVVGIAGRQLKPGDTVANEDWEFRVLESERRRLTKLELRKISS
jgi:CBS domain containing-hemolysin-like protein